MLTADLVRARVRDGKVKPLFVDPSAASLIERAGALIDIFESHRGEKRLDLDAALAELVGDETSFSITRGLAKLLHDRATWETVSPLDPVSLRRLVFESSAASHPVGSRRSMRHTRSRADVLSDVASELQSTPAEVVDGLYADMKTEQRLVAWKTTTAPALLDRYNVALAQGVLLRAYELRVELSVTRPSRLRQFFRWLKFHQLMHRTERIEGGFRVVVDGPMSLFAQSKRYGVQMARFLPAVLLTDMWRIEADVAWGPERSLHTFELDPRAELVTHLKPRGTYISEQEKTLRRRVRLTSALLAMDRGGETDDGGDDAPGTRPRHPTRLTRPTLPHTHRHHHHP